jgi:dUTP pyrophosphatase
MSNPAGILAILDEKTLFSLKVDVSTLPATSHTKVYVRCIDCDEEFLREFRNVSTPHHCLNGGDKYVERIPRIEVMKRNPEAIIPHRSRASDAGYDIHSLDDVTISPGDIVNIDPGLAVVAPCGYYITIEGRSSLYKVGVVPFRGIIDGGYTGTMMVTLMNVSTTAYHISKGDRIAQMVLHKLISADFIEVKEVSPEYNIRGTAGFGSSGS